MGNTASEKGAGRLQVFLYVLDSEVNPVLGSGRGTKCNHVISLKDLIILIRREKAYIQHQLENNYKFILTSMSWSGLALAVGPQDPKSLSLLEFQLSDL